MTATATPRPHSPPSRFALRFIEAYRSRVSHRLNARCRFEPSCSAYGLAAYRRYGFVKATAKTAGRLLRCNPWRRGTAPVFDPP